MKIKIAQKLSDKLMSMIVSISKNDFINKTEISKKNIELLYEEILCLCFFFADYCWYHLEDNPFSDSELYEILDETLFATIALYFSSISLVKPGEDFSPSVKKKAEKLRDKFKMRRKEYNVDIMSTEGWVDFCMKSNNNISEAIDISWISFKDEGINMAEISRNTMDELAEYLHTNIRPMKSGSTSRPRTTTSTSSGGGCFIATATYESPNSKEVMILRQWRDEYLLHSYFGRIFVKIYYVISPSIAKIIGKYNILRKISKNLLNRFIKKLDYK